MSERIRRPPPRRGSLVPELNRRVSMPPPFTSPHRPAFPEPTSAVLASEDATAAIRATANPSPAPLLPPRAPITPPPPPLPPRAPMTPPPPPLIPRAANNNGPEPLNVETLRRLIDDPNFNFDDFFAHFDLETVAPLPPPPCIGECQIHFEEVALEPPACCRFGVCAECFTTYTRLHVSEGNVKIRCPNPDCKSLMSREDIRLKLDAALKLKFDQFLVDANRDPHRKTCPRCSHITSDGAEAPGAGVKRVKETKLEEGRKKKYGLKICCAECQLEWCFPCQAPWHAGVTCQEYRKGDKLVKKWARSQDGTQFNAHRCPKCKIFIQRSTGCDHMQCTQCQTEFCYRCGERRRGLKYLQLLVGKHDGRLGVMGCKYSWKADKPAQRRLARGAILCAKLAAIPVALGLAVAVLPIALVVLPVGYGVVCARRAVRERRINRILVDWGGTELVRGGAQEGADILPQNHNLFLQLLREAGVEGEGERAGGDDNWNWLEDVEVAVDEAEAGEESFQEYFGLCDQMRAEGEGLPALVLPGEFLGEVAMAEGGAEGAAATKRAARDEETVIAEKDETARAGKHSGAATMDDPQVVVESEVVLTTQEGLGARTRHYIGTRTGITRHHSDAARGNSHIQEDASALRASQRKELITFGSSWKARGIRSIASESDQETAVNLPTAVKNEKDAGKSAHSNPEERKTRKDAPPLRTLADEERASFFLSLESIDDDLEQALRNLCADIDKLGGDQQGARDRRIADQGDGYRGFKDGGSKRKGAEDSVIEVRGATGKETIDEADADDAENLEGVWNCSSIHLTHDGEPSGNLISKIGMVTKSSVDGNESQV